MRTPKPEATSEEPGATQLALVEAHPDDIPPVRFDIPEWPDGIRVFE